MVELDTHSTMLDLLKANGKELAQRQQWKNLGMHADTGRPVLQMPSVSRQYGTYPWDLGAGKVSKSGGACAAPR